MFGGLFMFGMHPPFFWCVSKFYRIRDGWFGGSLCVHFLVVFLQCFFGLLLYFGVVGEVFDGISVILYEFGYLQFS